MRQMCEADIMNVIAKVHKSSIFEKCLMHDHASKQVGNHAASSLKN